MPAAALTLAPLSRRRASGEKTNASGDVGQHLLLFGYKLTQRFGPYVVVSVSSSNHFVNWYALTVDP